MKYNLKHKAWAISLKENRGLNIRKGEDYNNGVKHQAYHFCTICDQWNTFVCIVRNYKLVLLKNKEDFVKIFINF